MTKLPIPTLILAGMVLAAIAIEWDTPTEEFDAIARSPLLPGIVDTKPADCSQSGWDLRHLQQCIVHGDTK